MKKSRLFSLMAATMIATAASANFEYPEGSGVYYDIDDTGKAFVQWVDVSKVAGEVTIASEVNFEENNYAVTYFGEYGKFYGATGMTKVTIPASIDSIPEYWFQGCTNLEAVVIGSKKIGGNAFRGNAKLKNITLQEGVGLIYSAALCELPLLEAITLPSTLTLLGSWQFYNDTSLKEITFLGNVPTIEGDILNSVTSVTTINVPEGTRSAYVAALIAAGVTNANSIVSGEGTTPTGNFEFPEGSGVWYEVDDAGKAFVQWVDLSKVAGEVTIANEVESNGSKYPVAYFGEYGKFYGAENMTKVTIPASIDSIPEYWFQACTNLEAVVIGSKKIGGNAFRGDAKLKYITLEEGVEQVYPAAFCELPALETVTFPSTVTLVGSWQFYNNTSLKEITFKGNVPTIEDNLLTNVTTVTKITVPQGTKAVYVAALEAAGVANAASLVVEGESTGISSISRNHSASGELYNLQGQRVNVGTKGILIQNGKKILFR